MDWVCRKMRIYNSMMEPQELETFKTKKCEQQHQPGLSSLHLDCHFYHSRDDKRRPPLLNGRSSLAYSPNFIEDYYSTQLCSNIVEYLFHPDLYKTIPCANRLSPNYQPGSAPDCAHRYCPYLHQGETLTALLPLRGLPLLLPLQENYCHSIPEAQSVALLLTGTPAEVKEAFAAEIKTAKDRLRQVAREEEGRQEVSRAPRQPQVTPAEQIARTEEVVGGVKGEEWYTEYKCFYAGEKLPLIEDRHTQFKNYRDIVSNDIAPTVMKYIAAFLNSDGGVLYVGIDDRSTVVGLELTQHEFDRFLLKVDAEGKLNMMPPLMPHKYTIRRIPVLRGRKGRELWVVEVRVTPSARDRRLRVLTLYNREAFMRMNASTHKLDAISIIEYLRPQEPDQAQESPLETLQRLAQVLESRSLPAQQERELRQGLRRLCLRWEGQAKDEK